MPHSSTCNTSAVVVLTMIEPVLVFEVFLVLVIPTVLLCKKTSSVRDVRGEAGEDVGEESGPVEVESRQPESSAVSASERGSRKAKAASSKETRSARKEAHVSRVDCSYCLLKKAQEGSNFDQSREIPQKYSFLCGVSSHVVTMGV